MFPFLMMFMGRQWQQAPKFPAPLIDSILPGSGLAVGGTAIVIGGTGFQPGATVTVNGSPAALVVAVSGLIITALTPLGGIGSANVVVTNPDGQTSGTSGNGLFSFTLF